MSERILTERRGNVFVIMAVVLLIKPAGLFGQAK